MLFVILVTKMTEIKETSYAVSLLGFIQERSNESTLTASVDGMYGSVALSNRKITIFNFSIHYLFLTSTVLISIRATHSRVHTQIFSFLKKLPRKT